MVELTKDLIKQRGAPPDNQLWPAALIDRPYTEEDAAHYVPGAATLPEAGDLLRRTLSVVEPGGRVGILDYLWPRPPKWARLVACIGVVVGYGNRMRCYSVFERLMAGVEAEDEEDNEQEMPARPAAPAPAPEQAFDRARAAGFAAAIPGGADLSWLGKGPADLLVAGEGYDPSVLDDVTEEERNAVSAGEPLATSRAAAAEDF